MSAALGGAATGRPAGGAPAQLLGRVMLEAPLLRSRVTLTDLLFGAGQRIVEVRLDVADGVDLNELALTLNLPDDADALTWIGGASYDVSSDAGILPTDYIPPITQNPPSQAVFLANGGRGIVFSLSTGLSNPPPLPSGVYAVAILGETVPSSDKVITVTGSAFDASTASNPPLFAKTSVECDFIGATIIAP